MVGDTWQAQEPIKPARAAKETEEAREVLAVEATKPRGTPRGRESSSQKAQVKGVHAHGTSKARKTEMTHKTR